MTKIQKKNQTKKVNPATTTIEGKVVEQDDKKKIVGAITQDLKVIKFSSVEEAKKQAKKLRETTNKIDYVQTNIDFMEKVLASAIRDNSIVSQDADDIVPYGILVMPVNILNDLVRHRDEDQYTIIRQSHVVQEFSNFTIKVLKNSKENLEREILD